MLRQEQCAPADRTVVHRVECALGAKEIVAQAKQARATGFDGIELVLPPDSGVAAPSRSAALSDLHLDASAAHTIAVAATLLSTEVGAAAEASARLLQFGVHCSAKCLNLTLPAVLSGNCDTRGKFLGYQEALNFAYGLLHRLRFDAESAGVSIGLEVAAGGCLLSPVEVRELIDLVNSSAVGACLDFDRAAAIGNPRDWLLILRHRVHCVRIGAATYADRSAVSPGRPHLDPDAIVATLHAAGFDRIVSVAGRIDPCTAEIFRTYADRASNVQERSQT